MIRIALHAVLDDILLLRDTDDRLPHLSVAAIVEGESFVFTRSEDVATFVEDYAAAVTIIGISAASDRVIVRSGSRVRQLQNPPISEIRETVQSD